MSKKVKWLIGVVVIVFTTVLLFSIRSERYKLSPHEQSVENIRNDHLKSTAVPLKVKAEILKEKAESAFESLTRPELIREKSEKAEAKWLANWKDNFPWKPTHDPAVRFNPDWPYQYRTGSRISDINDAEKQSLHEQWERRSRTDRYTRVYHSILKQFFQDEIRFSKEFEQCYHILKEHGRGDNPALAVEIFQHLLQYHRDAKDPLSKLLGVYPKKDISEVIGAFSEF